MTENQPSELDPEIAAVLTNMAATFTRERHQSDEYRRMESSGHIGQVVRHLHSAAGTAIMDAFDILKDKFGLDGSHELYDYLHTIPYRYRLYEQAYSAETHVGCVDRTVARIASEIRAAGGQQAAEPVRDPRFQVSAQAKDSSGADIGLHSAEDTLVRADQFDDARRIQWLSCDTRAIAERIIEAGAPGVTPEQVRACSSRIENLAAGAREVALARLGEISSNAASLIASNVRALQAAIDLSEDLSVQNIAVMHHALLNASDNSIAGEYRDAQNWIRGNSPHTAEFVPPHPDRVLPAMEDLVAFMRRDDIPALTQAAIAHAQFETIHPFADGNGRTGRAIVSALLRAKGVTENVMVPVSSGLLTDARLYFEALGAYREGAIQPVVERFAESALWAVDNGGHLAADIRIAEKDFESRLSGAQGRPSNWCGCCPENRPLPQT